MTTIQTPTHNLQTGYAKDKNKVYTVGIEVQPLEYHLCVNSYKHAVSLLFMLGGVLKKNRVKEGILAIGVSDRTNIQNNQKLLRAGYNNGILMGFYVGTTESCFTLDYTKANKAEGLINGHSYVGEEIIIDYYMSEQLNENNQNKIKKLKLVDLVTDNTTVLSEKTTSGVYQALSVAHKYFPVALLESVQQLIVTNNYVTNGMRVTRTEVGECIVLSAYHPTHKVAKVETLYTLSYKEALEAEYHYEPYQIKALTGLFNSLMNDNHVQWERNIRALKIHTFAEFNPRNKYDLFAYLNTLYLMFKEHEVVDITLAMEKYLQAFESIIE